MINSKENGCLPNLKSQVIVPVGQRLLPEAVLTCDTVRGSISISIKVE